MLLSPKSTGPEDSIPDGIGSKRTTPSNSSPVVSQKLPNLRNFGFCERETDIIDDDNGDASDDEGKFYPEGKKGPIAGKIAPIDDPLLCEDILSCISALDDVIAEFDDPSLPYIYDDDASTSVPIQTQSSSSSSFETAMMPKNYAKDASENFLSEKDKLVVTKNERELKNPLNIGNSSVSDASSQNLPSNFKSTHHHHISMKKSPSYQNNPTGSTTTTTSFNTKQLPCDTPSTSYKNLHHHGDARHQGSHISNSKQTTAGLTKQSSNKSKSSGGTYSKGTNYEIILPRIPSSENSSRQVLEEPIYSSIGKSRQSPFLQCMFNQESSEELVKHPQEPEIDYNDDGGNTHSYNCDSGSSSTRGSGRFSKSSSSCGVSSSASVGASTTAAILSSNKQTEHWNFPSEKNLPRSLRKTRKTCMLNDKGEACEEKMTDDSVESLSKASCSIGGQSNTRSTSSYSAIKFNQNNGNNSTRDDVEKIYEDIVVISSSSNNAKSNHHQNSNKVKGAASCSPSTSLKSMSSNSNCSYNLSFSSDFPTPKPRIRQQIPSDNSQTKFPPGKIPKPNPKPGGGGSGAIEISSPFSPVKNEISRTEDEGKKGAVDKISKTEKILVLEGNDESSSLVSADSCLMNNNSDGHGNLNNDINTNSATNGNVMRMMMMMKPSGKNNSTGSTSSISRSSRSSSGGSSDPNYYRKDNLSSSSGIVVTTNSSATTASSPTHSVNNNTNNNSINNNITIITTEKGTTAAPISVIQVKGQQRQVERRNQQQQPSAMNNGKQSTVLLTTGSNGVLDVDDGYLSMINRNEAPLLWPEEFIENETFSPDELKRLSVHLPEEENTSQSDSDSSSEEKEIELEIVDYEREPSRRLPHHQNQPLKSASSSAVNSGNRLVNVNRSGIVEHKVEYFSDDSLEEEDLGVMSHQHQHQRTHKNNSYRNYSPNSQHQGAKRPVFMNISSSPTSMQQQQQQHKHPYQQHITVNHVAINHGKQGGHVSRIPKMISSSNSPGKKKSTLSDEHGQQKSQELSKRKPCSFFISLTDEGSSEVNVTSTNIMKSSSLPKGSKVAISPIKNSIRENVSQNGSIGGGGGCGDSPTEPDELHCPSEKNILKVNEKRSKTNNHLSNNPRTEGKCPTGEINFPLPQLRHTKSINSGGPRTKPTNHENSTTNNTTTSINANKRKSTSDLVTVISLNTNDTIDSSRSSNGHQLSPEIQSESPHAVVTSSFNRTSTFLIPSCSRQNDMVVDTSTATSTPEKLLDNRKTNDGTDNDDDDFSDFDIISSTTELEPDSIQPLSLDNVHDFVTEIMGAALKQRVELELDQNISSSTNKTLPIIASTSSITHSEETKDNKNHTEEQAVETQHLKHQCSSSSEEESKKLDKMRETFTSDEGSESLEEKGKSRRELSNENETGSGQEETSGRGKLSTDEDESDTHLAIKKRREDKSQEEKVVTVAEQLEAVVLSFLSENQSFLGQPEEEIVEDGADNECDLSENPITLQQNVAQGESQEENDTSIIFAKCSSRSGSKGDTVLEGTSSIDTTVDVSRTEDTKGELSQNSGELTTTSTTVFNNNNINANPSLKDSSLVGEDKILDDDDDGSEEEDSEEQPPDFVPTPPPPKIISSVIPPLLTSSQKNNYRSETRNNFGNGQLHHQLHHSNANVRDGKAALDLLAQRISNSRKFPSPDDQLQVSQFIHDKRNIWAMYDRPFDEELLTSNPGARGYASRSQENLMDAMTKERFHKSYSSRGQSSTLPLNCRPPATQRRSSTFRNMFSKFRKNKQTGSVIKEIPEYCDGEVQSITSRETGPSEQGKKRGFFSRLFRRSRKN